MMRDYDIDFNMNIIKIAIKQLAQDLNYDCYGDRVGSFTLWDIIKEIKNDDFLSLKDNENLVQIFRAINVNHHIPDVVEVRKSNNHTNSVTNNKNKDFYRIETENQLIIDFETDEAVLIEENDSKDLSDRGNGRVFELADAEKLKVQAFFGDEIKKIEDLQYLASLARLLESYQRPKTNLSKMKLSLLRLDYKTYKAVEKIESLYGKDFFSNGIQRFTIMDFSEFGVHEQSLVNLQKSVVEELDKISKGLVDYNSYESDLLVPRSPQGLSLEEIDKILIEDIDTFLDNLEENDVEILEKRWGFVSERYSLKDVGDKLGLSRERIRQRQSALEARLIKSIRIDSESLLRMIYPVLNAEITHNLFSLYECFNSREDFYDFLKLITDFSGLEQYIHPSISKDIFNGFFAEQGAPIDKQEALEYLKGLSLENVKSFENALYQLEEDGVLKIEVDKIWPCSLSKPEACACVLFDYPRGLPWSDVANIVNTKGFSRTNVYEDRLDSVAFDSPEHIFLSGKGVYKHTSFIVADEEDVEKALQELKKYAVSRGRSSFHLNEFYQSSLIKSQIDYYELRHFVKHLGEEYGLFFDGRSQTDSIGLTKDIERITQVDVIITHMNDNEKLLTKTDIANLLKSKSLNHAAFYIDKMMKNGQVVQVDRMLYTTPEVAYKNINIPEYLNAIHKILAQAGKPVEAGVFQDILNANFSNNYSKSFYASLARLYGDQKGWYRAYNIFSINEIPFLNTTDLLTKVCKTDYTREKNIELIKQQIVITNQVADVALNNWMYIVKYEGISSEIIN